MKKLIFSILILLVVFNPVKSQDIDLRELYLTAESYFLFEEFNEALPLYLRIHRHSPNNDNVNYKIGVCFLNNVYEKDKSIMYLETAVKNINPKYKENNYKENGAPLESLFYLANAYRVNNQLSKAREYYKIFLSRLDPEIYDTDLVNEQLAACDAAENLMAKPVDFDFEILPDKINTRFADTNPVISGDETKMAFISKLQFYDAVFYTEKVDGEWKPARNIVPELGVDGDVYPTFLSYNGTELLVYRNDNYIGNIYYSRIVNDKWTPLQKLGENINTKYWESHASLSKDSKTLYFSSNRKGGYGGLDIYKSERQQNGEWGIPENLGPTINTKYNDDTPFITDDGEKIYFSSYGHYNIGGYDNFLSKKNADGSWANPINLGSPINTTDDDQFFLPLKSGTVCYSSVYSEQGYGKHDIVRYQLYNSDNPRMFEISGLLDFMNEKVEPEEVSISVVEEISQDLITKVNPNAQGEFSFLVPAGNFLLIFDSEKFNRYIQKLEVSPDSPHEGFALAQEIPLELIPPIPVQKDISDYLSIREDSILTAEANENIKIKFNAEPGTFANIDVYNDSVNIYSDSMLIDKKRQSFEFEPKAGVNEVTISLRDEEGNTTSQKLIVVSSEDPNSKENIESLESDEKEIPQAAQESAELNDFQKQLIDNSEGALKEYIEGIDTESLGLKTKDDLTNYIYENLSKEGVDSAEFSKLLVSLNEKNSADILILEYSELANPELAAFLQDLNTDSLNINSPEDLFNYLYEYAEGNEFTNKDVENLYKNYKAQQAIEQIVSELNEQATGNLSNVLNNLDLKKEGITNYAELVDYLYEKVEKGEISEDELLEAINSYSDKKPQNNQLKQKIIDDERFTEFTSSIGIDSLSSFSNDQIYKALFAEPELYDMEAEELLRVLLEMDSPDLDLLISGLIGVCNQSVVEVLSNLPDSIQNAEELLDYLLKLSDDNEEFDRDDILKAYMNYLENKDFFDFLSLLKIDASEELINLINNLDLDEEGITGRNELIDYLLKNSQKIGLSKEDIYQIIAETDNYMNLRRNINKMIETADPNIQKALIDIIDNGIRISSLEDLIEYLLQNKDVYGYSEADVLHLLSEYLDEEFALIESQGDSGTDSSQFKQGLLKTGFILFLEGFIIFILIILARRRKKEDKKDK